MHIYTIGGRRYVFGLDWHLYGEKKLDDNDFRAAAHTRRAEAAVQHLERGVLTVGSTKSPETAGLASAASGAARMERSNWVGLFPLPDGKYWFVAVSDGQVIEGSDVVLDHHEDVLDRIKLLEQVVHFKNRYGPVEVMGNGAKPADLERILAAADASLVEGVKRTISTVIMEQFRRNKIRMIAVCVSATAFVSLGLVAFGYWQEQQKLSARMNEELLAAAEEEKRLTAAEEKIAALRALWLARPIPSQVIDSCRRALWLQTLPVAGWRVTSRMCKDMIVHIEWAREYGTVRRLQELSEQRDANIRRISDNSYETISAIVIDSLNNIRYIGKGSKGVDALRAIADDTGSQVSIQPPAPPRAPTDTLDGVKIVAVVFEMTSVIDVVAAGAKMDAVDGLVTRSVVRKFDGTWNIGGVLYHEQ